MHIGYRGSNIWNKRFISKQDRNVSYRVDPISRSLVTKTLNPDYSRVPKRVITKFGEELELY